MPFKGDEARPLPRKSHTRAVSSCDAVTTCVPSAMNDAEKTRPLCPSRATSSAAPAQIPYPCRLVVGRRDHMRSVGAERRGEDSLMPFEGDELGRSPRKSHTRAVLSSDAVTNAFRRR